MTSIAKLKDKARKHEQKEDWEAAIAVYRRVLDHQHTNDEIDLDLGLYNRMGDLNLRIGQTDEAVSYYEQAADKYAESGFYNNAIALCNKALRHRPDRPAIYLKLSRLCNEQGFQTDARRWILEYAEREVAAGEVEAALTGLEEFAELSDDPEIRELLAQQLASHDRQGEAIEQLRTAYAMRVQAGQTDKAALVAKRARSIDPEVDLEAEEPAAGVPKAGTTGAGAEAEPGPMADALAAPPAEGLDGLEQRTDTVEAEEADAAGVEGLEPTADVQADETAGGGVSGIERSFSEQTPPASPEEAEAEPVGGLETFVPEPGAASDEAATPGEPAVREGSADYERDDEVEPLPLLDDVEEGVEEEEAEEARGAEPLPTLDDEGEAEPAAEERVVEEEPVAEEPVAEEAVAEEPVAEEPVAEEPVAEEPVAEEPVAEEPVAEEPVAEEPVAEERVEAEPVPEELAEEGLAAEGASAAPGDDAAEVDSRYGPADDAMDLDLGSFDLGGGVSEEAVEDLDVDAVLDRAKQLVARGLTGPALRELHLLSGSDADEDDFRNALAVANEIIRRDANNVSALQQRVEYASAIRDHEILVDAYLDLAEALERLGNETKAQAMYERVLDLDPANEAAREALGDAAEDRDPVDLDAALERTPPEERGRAEDEGSGSSGEKERSDPNFKAMLKQFRAKVTENEGTDEAGDHYDLGLAFKEMGLIDEAISEFQTALTGGEERLKVYEELGQCFVLKGQYNVALKVFDRALRVPHSDVDDLLGVYYHLGQCHEELGQREEAREAYEKILSIDGSFADVPDRMARL